MKELLKKQGDFKFDVVFPVELQARKDDGENNLFTLIKAIANTMEDGVEQCDEHGSVQLTEDSIPYSDNFVDKIKEALGHEITPADVFDTVEGKEISGKDLTELKGDVLKGKFPIKVKEDIIVGRALQWNNEHDAPQIQKDQEILGVYYDDGSGKKDARAR
jgi:hypothetical protein